MNHKITIRCQDVKAGFGLRRHLRRCIRGALEAQQVHIPCEINVLLTNDEGIRQINRDNRDTDAATDVLSFPMFELTPGAFPADASHLLDPETGRLPLGDMCLSLERAARQAREYGHSTRRETGYLTVHSVLHLLGYDHMDEGPEKAAMRTREEAILSALGITRGDEQ